MSSRQRDGCSFLQSTGRPNGTHRWQRGRCGLRSQLRVPVLGTSPSQFASVMWWYGCNRTAGSYWPRPCSCVRYRGTPKEINLPLPTPSELNHSQVVNLVAKGSRLGLVTLAYSWSSAAISVLSGHVRSAPPSLHLRVECRIVIGMFVCPWKILLDDRSICAQLLSCINSVCGSIHANEFRIVSDGMELWISTVP